MVLTPPKRARCSIDAHDNDGAVRGVRPMKRVLARMGVFVACLTALLCWPVASIVRADPTAPDRFVVVLKPRAVPVEAWPAGTRAVISELVARGYELVVRSSVAKDLEGLRRELEVAAEEPAAVGSVAIFQSASAGTALVYTSRSGVVTIDADVSEGTLSESSVALRVSELFRDHAIAAPASTVTEPSAPRPVVPAAVDSGLRGTESNSPRTLDSGALFLSAGFAVSGDLGAPLALVGVGATSPHWGPLALDLLFAASPGSAGISTSAGEVRLSLQALRSHLVFDPWRAREAGLTLALGGGVIWTQASATGEGDYLGRGDETEVALLSARIAAFVRTGRFRFDLALAPGLMLPELALRAHGKEVAALGRPWTEISAHFGWAL
jgi:hypothetical protein